MGKINTKFAITDNYIKELFVIKTWKQNKNFKVGLMKNQD